MHKWGFFPSWTSPRCFFISDLFTHLTSQIPHLNGFIPSWTESIGNFKFDRWLKILPQVSHLKGFIPWCTDEICNSTLDSCEKVNSQIVHWYGFLSWLLYFLVKMEQFWRLISFLSWNSFFTHYWLKLFAASSSSIGEISSIDSRRDVFK